MYEVFSMSGKSTSGSGVSEPFTPLPVDPTGPIVVTGDITPPKSKDSVVSETPKPPKGPQLNGWFKASLYADFTCSGDPLYETAEAMGRCEMRDNKHYTLSQFMVNPDDNTASMTKFYYQDNACKRLKLPIKFETEQLGKIGDCTLIGNRMHYVKIDYDETHDSAPVFQITGPAQVSYDSTEACGDYNRVQGFTVFRQGACYSTPGTTGIISHHAQCSNSEGEVVKDTSKATSTFTQMYTDKSCTFQGKSTNTKFSVCKDVNPNYAVEDGPVVYNFGSFKTDYCGNTLQTGPNPSSGGSPPSNPTDNKDAGTSSGSGAEAGIIGGSFVGVLLLVFVAYFYRAHANKVALAAATAPTATTTTAANTTSAAAAAESSSVGQSASMQTNPMQTI
jgi:hypothetical protein